MMSHCHTRRCQYLLAPPLHKAPNQPFIFRATSVSDARRESQLTKKGNNPDYKSWNPPNNSRLWIKMVACSAPII